MSKARDLYLRLRSLVRRSDVERELADEMEFHVEMQARKHMANGAEPDEARRLARREFGNAELVKEDARDARGIRALEELASDARFGARLLRRSPVFAIVSIVAIGLAIGINAGFFTLFDTFVLRPIPIARPDRLVKAELRYAQGGTSQQWSYPQIQAIAHATTLSDVIPEVRCTNVAFHTSSSGTTGTAVATAPRCVSGTYFAALDGHALVGRTLLPADDRDDAAPAIVISDALWARAFARAPDIVGKDVVINNVHATVAGVMPPSFIGLQPMIPDFWMSFTLAARVEATPGRLDDDTNRFINLKARLRPGVSRAQAEAELSGLVAEPVVPTNRPDIPRVAGVMLLPNDSLLAPTWQTMLLVAPALVVVALVLVIACANLATLMLSRALARQREIAVRLAMGASRSRLIRQLLTEGLVIGLAGAALGLAWSRVTVTALSHAFFSSIFPATFGTVALDLSPSWRVLAYTIVLAALAVVSFGLVPALQVTSQSLTSSLKGEDAALGTRIRRSRFRDALVAAQVAGSLVLLVASSTLIVNMRAFGSAAPGIETRRVTVASLGFSASGRVPSALAASRAALDARVNTLKGVTATASALHAPFTSWSPSLAVAALGDRTYRQIQYNAVTPNYFTVVQQRLRGGRAFNAADSANDADVAIVTEATARTLWPAAPAVGQTLRVAGARDEPDLLYRVVGVVADAHSGMVWDNDDAGYIYLAASHKNVVGSDMSLLIRSDVTQPEIARAIEDAAHAIDPGAPLQIQPALAAREAMLTPIRYGTWITTEVGVFGLGLALVGLYGVVAFAVVQRRRDIAVHVALGAHPRDVIRLVLSRELRLVVIGLLAGLVLAGGEAQLIAAWVSPLAPLGWTSFVGLALALFTVAFIASLVPALAAVRIAPMMVLRQE